MKSLFKTVSLIVVFSVITRAVGFLFRIYLSRALGPETLGVYQVAFSIFIVLLTVISSGLPLVISKLTAKYRAKNDLTSERKMLSCSLIIALASSVILCAIVLIANKLFGAMFTDARSLSVLLMLLPALVFSAVYSTFRGSLWGHNNYFGVCVTELFEQVARVVLAVIMLEFFATTIDGAFSTAVSLTIASCLSAIFVMILYFSKGKKLASPRDHYKEVLKSSMPITGVRIASNLVQPLIAVIIPLRLVSAGYTSAQAMSQYGIATGMTLPLLFIPSTLIGALCMALIPDISTAVYKQDSEHISNRISSSIIFTIFITCLFIPLYLGAGEYIGQFFYDNITSGALLASASWIMLPMGLTSITASLLNAVGLEMKSLKNYIVGAVLMILCLWFLPKYIGVRSMIWAMGLCTTLASVLNIIMLKKSHCSKFSFLKPLLTMIVFILPTTALTSFLCNILNNFLPLFFTLAISCSVGAICFILLCLIFNVVNINAFIVSWKEKYMVKINKRKTIKNKA